MLCGLLLHVQMPMLGAFESLSQGWKLQGWGGGPWWALHPSQLDASTRESWRSVLQSLEDFLGWWDPLL